MNYKEITFIINPLTPYRDILLAYLSEISSFESFLEFDKGLKAYVSVNTFKVEEIIKLCEKINAKISFKVKNIDAKNWNSSWEESFKPVKINEDCIIRAPFHKNYKLKYEIIINPEMTFGTGHHETTYGIIKELFNHDINKKLVLDFGCGTGILSILSEKLGAEMINSIDICSNACINAKSNLFENKCYKSKVINGGAEKISGKFDYILANINKNVIIKNIEVFSKSLLLDGILIISGFYQNDLNDILVKAKSFKLEYINHEQNNKWVISKFKKIK